MGRRRAIKRWLRHYLEVALGRLGTGALALLLIGGRIASRAKG